MGLAKADCDFVPVLIGQSDVDHQRVDLRILDFDARLRGRTGLLRSQPELGQEIYSQRSHQRIVFNHEDFWHAQNLNIEVAATQKTGINRSAGEDRTKIHTTAPSVRASRQSLLGAQVACVSAPAPDQRLAADSRPVGRPASWTRLRPDTYGAGGPQGKKNDKKLEAVRNQPYGFALSWRPAIPIPPSPPCLAGHPLGVVDF